MYIWALLAGMVLLLAGSVWLRVYHLRMSLDNMVPVEPKTSPFSRAVQDLVATAGGVYLSLVMLVSFLKLELPERLAVKEIYFDPLAMTAITTAIVQPFISRLFNGK